MRLMSTGDIAKNLPPIASARVIGYSLTKGVAIGLQSQAIFILVGNLSFLAAVALTVVTLIQIETSTLSVLITLFLLTQALYIFIIGYIDYEYFLTRHGLYLVQILIILISVFSLNFNIRIFILIMASFYLSCALIMLSTGASLDNDYDSGSLVTTDADMLNNYQALAHVFGVNATIFAIVALRDRKRGWLRIWLTGAAAMFVILTFYSGWRGKLIASTLIVIITISRSNLWKTLAIFLIAVYALAYSDFLFEIQQSSDYNRILYALENNNSGMQGELFSQALTQFASDDIFQIFFGQSVNAFQHYQKYEFGLYPHNLLIEILLTSGLVMFMFYFLLYLNVAIGLFARVGHASLWTNLFFGIACNYLILTMKSGTFSDSAVGICFLFIAWFRPEMRSFFKPRRSQNMTVAGLAA